MRLSARWVALALCVVELGAVAAASAEPIIKPRKYHGPIPQSMAWLRVGFMGDASNEEMNTYLDGLIQPPFTHDTEDFGTALVFDAGYARKPHPQFAFRLNASMAFLSSTSTGNKPTDDADSLLTVVDYSRDFKSDLIVLEASGMYFFSDAAVKEFQSYIGGGFSLGIPHESFEETQIDIDTGEVFRTIETSEWGFSAGVHAVLGAIYYLTNTWGITTEGRLQLMEGKYDQLQAPDENGVPEDVSFVIDYSGFYVTVGVLWGF
ncbi:MAG TPA: hypothetical protein VEC56_06590 [Candidatus Krumholzibacteria bacterium]|nr:hypothetical protein [Candidatus Krumholzibacteria bacterium]